MRAEPRWLRWLVPALSLAAGISLWEFLGSRTSAAFLSTFSATMSRLAALVRSGEFTEALAQSLGLFAAGFALAAIVAVPLGLLLARMRLLRVALEPYIMALYATPMAALTPFILSMMGFGFAPKVVVVYLFAVFPILYNTIEGARSVRPELIEVARSFRSSEWRLWRDVMIPYTLPFALTGMRQGIGRGLVGMVVAEFFLSASGIGRLIIVISVLGASLMGLGRLLENRFAAWRGIGR